MLWANRRSASRLARRRGSLTIELIMVLVVLVIVTVAIVQFGVFFANSDEFSLAARVGAEEASQTAGLPTAPGPVPASIIGAIEHQLLSSQIQWSHIRLEHNVTPGNAVVVLNSDTGAGFFVRPKANLAAPPFPGTHYVRLTVTVPEAELYPRALSYFGEQLFGPNDTCEYTNVFRYELTRP
jgi:Flp pilus assembly protein TadG